MCGIFGFNWADKELLNKGLEKMNHRGPDDTGIFLDKNTSLGHNRLSIIDLSKAGKQPMCNETQDIWITFNGEIYNFKEIRSQLKEKHRFKSKTDTEILIHLYEEKGTAMLKDLQGMFAFCIYDKKKNIFFLARDRVGIKPLYYYKNKNQFMFSSEIKSILQNRKIKRGVNFEALSSYLAFRANTEEETFFNNIKRIMPGHFLIFNLKNNKLSVKKYWDLSSENLEEDKKYFKNKLRLLIEDSVKARLISDVPYGVYLSGGVDSGTIATLVSKYSVKKLKTFSVGFKEDQHSELNEARSIAQKLGADHHELVIDKSSIKYLPEIIYQSDEPLADPTAIPVYLLSKYSKKYCTVILTGEGADELFAGYPQYKFMKVHKKSIRKLPLSVRKFIVLLIKSLPKRILNKGFNYAGALGEKGLERFSNFIYSNDIVEQYINQVALFNEEEQKELLKRPYPLYQKYKPFFNEEKVVESSQLFEFKNSMVEDLLMKIDKNTMAFAVEGRVPFLDYRIVELSNLIPQKLKLKGLNKDKYIFREAVKDLLPSETRKRKKHHFFVPIDSWLEEDLKGTIESLLSKEYVEKQGIFNYRYIEKIKKDFPHSKLFYARQLWSLLVFQIWYKIYIEENKINIK